MLIDDNKKIRSENYYIKYFLSNNHIYHFTSTQTFIDYILKSQRLRLTRITGGNDPEESIPRHFKSTFTNELVEQKRILEVLYYKDIWEKYTDDINQKYFVNARQLCFSKNIISVDDKVEHVSLLDYKHWAQYARNHNGVCLVVNKKNFDKEFNSQFKNETLKMIADVKYEYNAMFPVSSVRENIYDLSLDELDNYSVVYDEGILLEKIVNNFPAYFFVKDKCWEHENEVKAVLLSSKTEDIYMSLKPFLDLVVVGLNVSDADFQIITDDLKKYNPSAHLTRLIYEYGEVRPIQIY